MKFVQHLEAIYTLSGHRVVVSEEFALEDEKFVSVSASSRSELTGRVSGAIAALVTDDISLQRGIADSIYRLLTSSSAKEMERYLRSRGISWEFSVTAPSPRA